MLKFVHGDTEVYAEWYWSL